MLIYTRLYHDVSTLASVLGTMSTSALTDCQTRHQTLQQLHTHTHTHTHTDTHTANQQIIATDSLEMGSRQINTHRALPGSHVS